MASTNAMSHITLANQGLAAVEAKHWDEAVAKLSEALQSSTNPAWLIGRSKALVGLKRFDEALDDADLAWHTAYERNKRPLMVEAHYRRAIAHYRLGQLANADCCCVYAMRLTKGSPAKEKEDPKLALLDEHGRWKATLDDAMDEAKNHEANAGDKSNAMALMMDAQTARSQAQEWRLASILRMQILRAMGSLPENDAARKVTVSQVPEHKKLASLGGANETKPEQPKPESQQPAATAPIVQDMPLRVQDFQSNTTMSVSIFSKGNDKEKLTVEFLPSSVRLNPVVHPGGVEKEFALQLWGEIDVAASKYTVTANKIELTLAKKTPGKWGKLEKDEAVATSAAAPKTSEPRQPADEARQEATESSTPASKPDGPPAAAQPKTEATAAPSAGPAYPSSSRTGPKNWDKIGADEDEEEEGDVNLFFKKLYKNATPEQQRAMMKSFTESSGTSLSTDWNDVKGRKVETVPPEGVEAKKWSVQPPHLVQHLLVPARLAQLLLGQLGRPLDGAAVRLGLASGDVRGSAEEVLGGDVGAAQPAGPPGADVEGGAAVHGAQVVEEDALAGLHLAAVDGGRVVDEALEDAGGLDPGAQVLGGAQVLALEGRAPVDAGEAPVAAVAGVVDDVARLEVVVAVLVVLVGDVVVGEGRHAGAGVDKGPQQAADALAVAEEALAAGARVVHAVQDLDHGRGVEVHEVLVQAEVAAGVGDVLGVGLGADVEGAAVKGLADAGHARRDAHDGVLVAGDVLEVDDAEAADVDDGVPEGLAAAHVVVVVDAPHVGVERRRVPVLHARAAQDGALAREGQVPGGAALEGHLDRRPGEDHLVLAAEARDVAVEDDGEALVDGAHVGDANVGGDLDRGKRLLARGRVAAARAGAAVAQGGGLEGAAAARGAVLDEEEVARPGDGDGPAGRALEVVDELRRALGDLRSAEGVVDFSRILPPPPPPPPRDLLLLLPRCV
ncbi:sgs [Purpureocillium lavendulum]|uniref:Sgs n=1 Tax=Purpureocillium lavendulum TaxID=1247861 RepID=A0AB34FGQ7_9HYPO|nr:sgs [Purpureocillium lavendulum]